MVNKITTIVLCILFTLSSSCVTTVPNSGKKIDHKKALESNLRLGMTYLQNGDRDNAIRSFSKALEIDKRSAEAYQGMALVHNLNGETDLAEENFKKALRGKVSFTKSPIEFSYGLFLSELDRCDEALGYFDKAAKDIQYTGRANALVALGLCAAKTGDRTRAKASYEHALNLNKRLPRASIELAEMAYSERDYSNAKKHLDQFAANTKQTPRSLWLGIRLERIFGNKDKEASYALALKNLYPYSKEYLEYKNLIEQQL